MAVLSRNGHAEPIFPDHSIAENVLEKDESHEAHQDLSIRRGSQHLAA